MGCVKRFVWIVLLLLGLSSCTQTQHGVAESRETMIDSLVPEFSHSFRVEYYRNYKLITVFTRGKEQSDQYVLTGKGVKLPAYLDGAVRIETPVERLGCLSTTHVGAMQLLDARYLIAVATNTELICDSIVNAMISNGNIRSAGHDYQPDYEMIAAAHPQVLFSDGENSGSSQIISKLRSLHIAVASSRDYFEQDPLARAEWIKFFAAFINKEKVADSIFRKVRSDYTAIKKQVTTSGQRPTVFCNLPYNGIWYMPCGKNYVARLITDAGGDFLWTKEEPVNGLNLTLNFEQVYARAVRADFWMNPGVVYSLRQLSDQDPKFRLFDAYKKQRVYNCIKRLSKGGGMDMWETGTFRPDIVLGDLASIFHSQGPTEGLYYYRQIK